MKNAKVFILAALPALALIFACNKAEAPKETAPVCHLDRQPGTGIEFKKERPLFPVKQEVNPEIP